jgi:hypothetical protein
MTVTRDAPNPAEQLRRLMLKRELTPEEETAVRAAIEAAMVKVDDALAVVNAMIEEIEVRKEKAREAATEH